VRQPQRGFVAAAARALRAARREGQARLWDRAPKIAALAVAAVRRYVMAVPDARWFAARARRSTRTGFA